MGTSSVIDFAKEQIGRNCGTFVRWTMGSCYGFVMIWGLTTLLHEVIGIQEKFAYAVPLIILFFTNFFICRYFVFGNSADPIVVQFTKFAKGIILFRIIEYVAFLILVHVFEIWYQTVILIVQPTSYVTKFFYFGKCVFVRSSSSGTAAEKMYKVDNSLSEPPGTPGSEDKR